MMTACIRLFIIHHRAAREAREFVKGRLVAHATNAGSRDALHRGQRDSHSQSASGIAEYDLPTMVMDDCACDRQAEPDAACFAIA